MKFTFPLYAILFLISSSLTGQDISLERTPLIPLPDQIQPAKGTLAIDQIESIQINGLSHQLNNALVAFQSFWREKTSSVVPIFETLSRKKNSIQLVKTAQETKSEAYDLTIGSKGIKIVSSSDEGLYRGLTTLKQMVAFGSSSGGKIKLPMGEITDSPSYTYRGAMLDVARHFFDVDDLKRYIDILSFYKMNYLHLHLSDDQGWRIEIKKWPKLTTVGGLTEVGGTPGGYFTQEDYQELVAYAADRFITLVPEIDIPGHTNAALVSYQALNCEGKTAKVHTGIEVGFSTLCAEKQLTYTFLKDVIDEISALTPGPYFHIGGDESYVTPPKDFIQMIDSVVRYVEQNNKKPITWDNKVKTAEIAQFWNSESTIEVIGKSKQIIYSPAKYTYLDMKYDSLSPYGLSWAGYSSVKHAYNWDPSTVYPEGKSIDILGIEAPLWSETIATFDEISYLAFPRLIGHAEIGWTKSKKREWKTYKNRLESHIPYLVSQGVATDHIPELLE